MRAALDAGRPAGGALDAMEDEQVRLLRTDPEFRDALRAAYDEAGVNLVSATMGSLDPGKPYAVGVREDLARWQARVDAVPWLRKATSPAAAREIVADGDVGVVLNTQNLGLAIEGDVDAVEDLYNAGVRVGQLTYNSQNLVGHGCTERVDAGLSHHGVAVVERMNDLGMVVDLSHCGRETTLDAVSVSERPVAYTHTFCEALSDHDRGKSDEELARLRETDGYVGVLAVPFFLEPGNADADFGTFLDHVDRMVDRVGIDRVGIGTDWGSWTTEVPEALREGLKAAFYEAGFRDEHGLSIGVGYGPMERYEDWGAVPEGLADRGYDADERRKLLGENVLAFWERATA
jgi:membrane dipeptidase